MRYFLDTEFIEDGKTINLISIGIVAEDGREFYGLNWDCDFQNASDWVKDNVLCQLPFRPLEVFSVIHRKPITNWYSYHDLRDEVAKFMGCEYSGVGSTPCFRVKDGVKPEIWGYYADYDWVVFCWLFGAMIDLPSGFPMYCRDIKQWCDSLGNPALPGQAEGKHNALNDARWCKQAWEFLREL